MDKPITPIPEELTQVGELSDYLFMVIRYLEPIWVNNCEAAVEWVCKILVISIKERDNHIINGSVIPKMIDLVGRGAFLGSCAWSNIALLSSKLFDDAEDTDRVDMAMEEPIPGGLCPRQVFLLTIGMFIMWRAFHWYSNETGNEDLAFAIVQSLRRGMRADGSLESIEEEVSRGTEEERAEVATDSVEDVMEALTREVSDG